MALNLHEDPDHVHLGLVWNFELLPIRIFIRGVLAFDFEIDRFGHCLLALPPHPSATKAVAATLSLEGRGN
jgi:hypothetical protein